MNNLEQALAQRIEQSETRITKVIFPNKTNHHDTLFGGQALAWMDEVAFIAASRFSRKKMVTVSSDQVDFKHPIPSDSIVELVAKVTEVGKSSCKVTIDIFVEGLYKDNRMKAITGVFSFVAIGEDKKPTLILDS